MAQSYEGGRSRIREELQSPAHDVATDFAVLQQDLAKLVSAFGRVAQSQLGGATTRIQSASKEWSGQAGEYARHGAEVVGEKVRERPISSLGVSLGVGVVVGLALASLTRR